MKKKKKTLVSPNRYELVLRNTVYRGRRVKEKNLISSKLDVLYCNYTTGLLSFGKAACGNGFYSRRTTK